LDNLYPIFFKKLIEGDNRACAGITKQLLDGKTDIHSLYHTYFQKALYEIGTLWQDNKISVAKEHLCTAIIQKIMTYVYGTLEPPEANDGKVIITCVGNELHEIGARMVADFYEMDGWDVNYLGANVPTDDIISMVVETKPHILGISCTMDTQIQTVRKIIDGIREVDNCIKITVGGYCFNKKPELAEAMGADFWALDAKETVALSKSILDKVRDCI